MCEIEREVVINMYRDHVNSGFAKLSELMQVPLQVKSNGPYVYDETGERYLDCGGYGVFLLGHSHHRIIERIKQQIDKDALSNKLLINPEIGKAAKALVEITPESLDYVLFLNSGTEAVEAGLKIARLNNRSTIISTKQGFHGKTLGALSATGRKEFQEPFKPLLPNVFHVTYGSLEDLEATLKNHQANAVVILEPIQAEGGVNIPPQGYLLGVRELCDKYEALLIIDEIQTGLGRLGDWWGINQEGVIPDMLLTGKILSGGIMPVSAVLANKKTFEQLNKNPLLHTSTYSGNALAMVAVQETISVIQEEGLILKAKIIGERFQKNFEEVLEENKAVLTDIRGRGLLWGFEFKDSGLSGRFMMGLLKKKIIVSNSLNSNKVVRITPPAILDDEQIVYIENSIKEVVNQIANTRVKI
ncbi:MULTISPECIES: aspartate aminotransferase family protein [Lysinibacillus]|uniref:aspartate aminotransferase family protein n=1 Tax=Lysinibacillus TaxID=400634 RepID=UPI00214CD7A6|nr:MULTISPECIES: aminotransferase class III-fold pyridoxal phosphate-dependent enzyme [Lysinibacillus]UNT54174.1 aspartate aminotransferase family protein [Lysinibacillus capsici]UUV26194.1 aminotransferase class III-fold pyridoxal phosphate-dependent enzyme [Lysinibacillus sp. FN11]UYB49066.1 aminotransferase class III-fold pyridoxal phosphate-dependent enzyme [Lysinibacillus capsici]WHP43511.1 aminotransferase class III-fold pyridoxal phosphate-dependent enzyme [Lysinibacillus boronitolerans]